MMRTFRSMVIIGLAGWCLLGAAPAAEGASPPTSPAGLQPMEPRVCGSDDDDIQIYRRYISAEGTAVRAFGNCDIEIYGSFIEAGGVGVLASGNSDISIYNTHVEGGSAALVAEGNGTIAMRGSRIVGGTVVRGNGEIEDDGGNEVSGRASAEVRSQTTGISIGPEGVRVESGGETITVKDDLVRVESGGQVTEVTGDWRTSGTIYTTDDTQQILVDLGATVVEGRLRLQVAGDVLFDFDSAAIRPDAAAELAKVAHVIRESAEETVSVAGHTDSIGEPRYNQKLSEQRAMAVMRWLNTRENIPAGLMQASGAGETQPRAHNTMPDGSDDPVGRAKNRRVEISFVASENTRARVSATVDGVRIHSGGADVDVEASKISVHRGQASELPASCLEVCGRWPAVSDDQATCVTAMLEFRGYSVIGNLACVGVETTAHCVTCWLALGASEEDCAAVASACLGW